MPRDDSSSAVAVTRESEKFRVRTSWKEIDTCELDESGGDLTKPFGKRGRHYEDSVPT